MVQLKINGKSVKSGQGVSLLDVATAHGINIPNMCNNGEVEHFTSCMICLVKDVSTGAMLPSCSMKAREGMDIITDDDEIAEARKTALELLLSEHAGDCEAPCRIACPAFMDIPHMNRLIAAGKTAEALSVVMEDIALPGVLGRICPAPCEGACKRKPIDEAVSICLLKRFTADEAGHYPSVIRKNRVSDPKKVAIIGSGPAGLAAGFYLQASGIQAFIYDSNELPGGALRYAISDEQLDKSVLDREIDHIKQAGVEFFQLTPVGRETFEKLRSEYDAIVIATGNFDETLNDWGLSNNGKQLLVNKDNYLTNLDKVFAIGNVNRSMQLAIRSLAQGKEVAKAVVHMIAGKSVTGEQRRFNSVLGRLLEEEYPEYMKEGSAAGRHDIADKSASGFDAETAVNEAKRCLHCDCRKPNNCKLRDYADHYQASRKRFSYSPRKPVKKHFQRDVLVFEPGKCIKCGLCVRLTAKHGETFGFTFIGRGFDVEIGVPFDAGLEKALQKTAHIVAEACPTGALSNLTD